MLKTFRQRDAVCQENREFLDLLSISAKLRFVFMAYFHLDSMTFVEFWMGRGPGCDIDRPHDLTKSLEGRIAVYLKVHQVFSDTVTMKVRRLQKEKNLWITSGDERIGIGEFTGKLVPIIAFPHGEDDDTPERQAIFKIGLTYVAQALNRKLFTDTNWQNGISTTAIQMLSIEFVVLNKRGEIVHDARQNGNSSDMPPGTAPVPVRHLAFFRGSGRAEFHNAIVAATSVNGKPTLVPVLAEDGCPRLVLVTPLENCEPGHALVIFESEQTDHAWLLGQLFDIYKLTPSERRVARGIILGQTIADIASEAAWSVATVRSYLKQVLSKMGLHRQSELISLYHSWRLPIVNDQAPQSPARLSS